MSKRKPDPNKVEYRDMGLEIALVMARYFFHTDYLHYGYWTEDLAVQPDNILRAQENYCELLLAHIPAGTKTILDVGCGTGKFTQELLSRGYCVDCVSPSGLLTRQARQRLPGEQTFFECKYEDLQTERRYDLILFSESFQYVPLERAFENSEKFLAPNGHLLICDFFGSDMREDRPTERSPLNGGHSLRKFYDGLERHHYDVLHDQDITAQTAPNLDLVHGLLNEVAFPIYRSVSNALKQNQPLLHKLLMRVYRKKLAKLRRRYTGSARTGATFACFKSYRLLVLQKMPAVI